MNQIIKMKAYEHCLVLCYSHHFVQRVYSYGPCLQWLRDQSKKKGQVLSEQTTWALHKAIPARQPNYTDLVNYVR